MALTIKLFLGYIIIGIGSYVCLAEGETGCEQQLEQLLFSDTGQQQLRALDSFGRPEAGFLNGQNTAVWYGHYSECSNLEEYQYCLIDMDVDHVVIPPGIRGDSNIRWGVCVPDNCTEEDINSNIDMLLGYLLKNFNANLSGATPSTSCVSDPHLPYSTGFYVTASVAGILFALSLLGSILDILGVTSQNDGLHRPMKPPSMTPSTSTPGRCAKKRGEIPLMAEEGSEENDEPESNSASLSKFKSASKDILLAFALSRNLAKLMNVQEGPGAISCLHGMRVLSMIWIIVGHVFDFDLRRIVVLNTSDIKQSRGFLHQMILLQYYVGVDTFFFLSGVLVCYTTLGKLNRNDGHLRWHWFYIHRYIRLTPLLCTAIAFHRFIAPYFYDGPEINAQVHIVQLCDSSWWANLLYVQNFISLSKRCLHVSWYLAVDMQFFVISPIIIYSLYRKASLGLGQIGILLLVNATVTAALSWQLRTPASIHDSIINNPDYFYTLYDKPYTRMPPYLFGIMIGYLLYERRMTGLSVSPTMSYLCWAVAALLACLVLAPWPDSAEINDTLAQVISTGYQTLYRFAWSGFLLWVVIFCHFGGNGLVNTILSWKAWIPLSRATYGAYLLHLILARIFWYNHIQLEYVSTILQTFTAMGVATLAYIVAGMVYVAVELPVARLEQLYLPKP